MPKKRDNEMVRCKYFQWKLFERHGVWNADGRSNTVNARRHSLGTRDYEEALRLIHDLDATIAADLGLAPRPTAIPERNWVNIQWLARLRWAEVAGQAVTVVDGSIHL